MLVQPWQYGLLSVKPVCQETEKVEWVTKCEDYPEVTCTSSHKESCEKEMFKNCTGVISTEVERICFSLNEQICKLKEHVTYDTVEEHFLVTKCSKVKERICDTIFHTSTFLVIIKPISTCERAILEKKTLKLVN